MKKIKGIRKRWMMNSISVVLFIVLLAVTAFSAAIDRKSTRLNSSHM